MTTVRTPLGPDGWLLYDPSFVPEHRSLMVRLFEGLDFEQEVLVINGQERWTPRMVFWMGDEGASYTYSNTKFDPWPFSPLVSALREQLRPIGEFNSVLLNYYRDGQDSIGFHADDEPELGPESPGNVLIASISLGGRRKFVLKRKDGTDKREFMLGGGDLLVMGGDVQRHWVHGIAKTALPVLPRMNLTFRQVRRS